MLDEDGLPLDEVGPWAKEKHKRLCRYVDITRGVRKKWVEGTGGATYVDLFCGSGRGVVRDTGERIDGSPLVALKSALASGIPFSEIYIADEAEERCSAADERLTRAGASPRALVGSAESTARLVLERLKPYGLHLIFLDPYNLGDLPFSVLETFSKLKYVDMLIHISASDLQRNLDLYATTLNGPLDRFAPGWRDAVDIKQSKSAIRAAFIGFWVSKMETLGFPSGRAELIVGTKKQRLYWLVLVSRHTRANEFWNKIRNISGQGELL